MDGPVGVVVEVGISHYGLIRRGLEANTPGQVRGVWGSLWELLSHLCPPPPPEWQAASTRALGSCESQVVRPRNVMHI